MNKIKIGNLKIILKEMNELEHPCNLNEFKSDEGVYPNITYEFHNIDGVEEIEGYVVYQSYNISVFNKLTIESRILKMDSQLEPYAYYVERSVDYIDVYISSSFRQVASIDTIFISTLALERHMIQYDSFILHCAYLNYHEKAILFSGPSGSGKSTHSNLWVDYVGAEAINGDRALIECEEEGIYANGWPICGSSNICLNKRYPIGAVIMMGQGDTNEVRRLSLPEAFRKIMSETTINYWNKEFVAKAMDLITAFISKVPVYEYRCIVDKSAVVYLQNQLQEELPWMR